LAGALKISGSREQLGGLPLEFVHRERARVTLGNKSAQFVENDVLPESHIPSGSPSNTTKTLLLVSNVDRPPIPRVSALKEA